MTYLIWLMLLFNSMVAGLILYLLDFFYYFFQILLYQIYNFFYIMPKLFLKIEMFRNNITYYFHLDVSQHIHVQLRQDIMPERKSEHLNQKINPFLINDSIFSFILMVFFFHMIEYKKMPTMISD